MPLWTAYAAAALIVATTAIIYPIDIADARGEKRWVHLSGLLNGGCSDDPVVALVAGVGNFGYGLALSLINESFRRVLWADGKRGKYFVGLASILSFYLVLGFPTGRHFATDVVHHSATGVGAFLFFAYAALSVDLRHEFAAMIQNLATVGLFGAGVALAITYLVGEIDRIGWNGFVASQLAYGIAFIAFLLSWGTLRSGPDRPRSKKNRE